MNDNLVRGLVYGLIIGGLTATWFTIGNGSWVPPTALERMKTEASNNALNQAFAEICFTRYMAEPDRAYHQGRMKSVIVYQQREYIKKRGWSVMPGLDRTYRETADMCQEMIEETF